MCNIKCLANPDHPKLQADNENRKTAENRRDHKPQPLEGEADHDLDDSGEERHAKNEGHAADLRRQNRRGKKDCGEYRRREKAGTNRTARQALQSRADGQPNTSDPHDAHARRLRNLRVAQNDRHQDEIDGRHDGVLEAKHRQPLWGRPFIDRVNKPWGTLVRLRHGRHVVYQS